MLSVIIITKNEASSITACLRSVSWANEIIVVDSGSTDDTVSICKKHGAIIHTREWTGFGAQKNYALSLASNKWVLSIDADERVTTELKESILKVISKRNEISAWRIPRLSSFCGSYIFHSGWHPDYVTRLFKRESARFSDDIIHEKVVVNGKTGTLKENLLHESIESIDDLLNKMNYYTTAGALTLNNAKKKTSLKKAIFKGIWAFFRAYIVRAGFLDGRSGFMIAISAAETSYYKQIKLLMMQEQ